MSEATGTVIAAIAGGIFTLAAAYTGMLVGRRQTTDQATVEHGQWLRGQRQAAYAQFLDTWDDAIARLEAFQDSWDECARHAVEDGEEADLPERAAVVLLEAWDGVRRTLDRVELLGPQKVDLAVAELRGAFRNLHGPILEQAESETLAINWGRWNQVLTKAAMARFKFQVAAMETLRTPPSPDQR
jgi:hypothetical protein